MAVIPVVLLALTAPAQAHSRIADDPALVVRIEVSGDPVYSRPHAISIRAQETPPSSSAGGQDVWLATREWEGGSQSLISTDCPAIRAVAISVSDLPPVRLAPAVSAPLSGAAAPIPPTVKDGFQTVLSFQTETDDGSRGQVTVTGGNVYQRWGHDAVASLLPCWGPLAP